MYQFFISASSVLWRVFAFNLLGSSILKKNIKNKRKIFWVSHTQKDSGPITFRYKFTCILRMLKYFLPSKENIDVFYIVEWVKQSLLQCVSTHSSVGKKAYFCFVEKIEFWKSIQRKKIVDYREWFNGRSLFTTTNVCPETTHDVWDLGSESKTNPTATF